MASETGQPLRRVAVTAFPQSPGSGTTAQASVVTRTDDDGAYVLRELPAGTYIVAAHRAGYTESRDGKSPAVRPRITLEDGSSISSINFQLQRGGVITGRVTDDAGDPVEGALVQVLRAQRVRGRVRFGPAGARPVMTDDRGHYRIHGLSPGEYVVAAEPTGARIAGTSIVLPADDGRDLVTTYAPATAAPGEAQSHAVGAGQEIPVDVQLVAGRLVTLAGRVLDSAGMPAEGGTVRLTPRDADVMLGLSAGHRLATGGAFVIPGVAPGAYMLSVETSAPPTAAGQGQVTEREGASVPIVVAGEDAEGLVITTSPPSTVTGRLVVEGDASELRGAPITVGAHPVDTTPMRLGVAMSWGSMGVAEDLTVRLGGLRGEQVLSIQGLPRGWWVKSVRIGGKDAQWGFDFGAGRAFKDLEIVLNNRPASIGGRVTGADGQGVTDYIVIVFPDDVDSVGGTRPRNSARSAWPDQDGSFVLEGLRPGRYYVVAVAPGQLEGMEMDDPDALRTLSRHAEKLEIAEGEQQYLGLTLAGIW